MCKPLLTTVPLDYIFGFHCATNVLSLQPGNVSASASTAAAATPAGATSRHARAVLDEELLMVHLKRIDYGLGHQRHMARALGRLKLGGNQELENESWRADASAEFNNWYYDDGAKVQVAIDEQVRRLL